MIKERLSKIIASCNVASRRKSELLILAGKVKVNGQVVTDLSEKFCFDEDVIELDGHVLSRSSEKIYIALNKPVGFECSRRESKKSVYNLLGGFKDKVFSVGRLDIETSGLIFMTNDGSFCNFISHPSNGIKKHYIATVKGEVKHFHTKKIGKGTIINGTFSKPLEVEKIGLSRIRVVVAEGKKHEVRILVALSGLELVSLERTQIGMFKLGTIPVGKWREVSKKTIFCGCKQ